MINTVQRNDGEVVAFYLYTLFMFCFTLYVAYIMRTLEKLCLYHFN